MFTRTKCLTYGAGKTHWVTCVGSICGGIYTASSICGYATHRGHLSHSDITTEYAVGTKVPGGSGIVKKHAGGRCEVVIRKGYPPVRAPVAEIVKEYLTR